MIDESNIKTAKNNVNNKDLIKKSSKYLAYFLSAIIVISLIIHLSQKQSIKTYFINIIFSNIFILIFIIFTQYIFSVLILKKLQVVSINEILKIIFDILEE